MAKNREVSYDLPCVPSRTKLQKREPIFRLFSIPMNINLPHENIGMKDSFYLIFWGVSTNLSKFHQFCLVPGAAFILFSSRTSSFVISFAFFLNLRFKSHPIQISINAFRFRRGFGYTKNRPMLGTGIFTLFCGIFYSLAALPLPQFFSI